MTTTFVIPAQAGIQGALEGALDPRLREDAGAPILRHSLQRAHRCASVAKGKTFETAFPSGSTYTTPGRLLNKGLIC